MLHQRANIDPPDRSRVYKTATIAPGDEVYVLGTARFDGADRVIEGGDDRFIVAGASQLRTLGYTASWALFKFVGSVLLIVFGSVVLLSVAGVV